MPRRSPSGLRRREKRRAPRRRSDWLELQTFDSSDDSDRVSWTMTISTGSADMVQVLAATFEDGVFKPDQRPALSDSARVRLMVETIDVNESARADESWAALEDLWRTSS